jgi:hypothetical protein
MSTKKPLIVLVAVLAIAGSAFLLLHQSATPTEQLASDASTALGQRAGEEVAQLLGNKGRIAVLGLETAAGQAPTYVTLVDVFTKTLKAHHVEVAATKIVPGGLNRLMLGTGLSGPEYRQLLDQTANMNAIVTFVGPPALPPDELRLLQVNRPPLVVVDMFGVVKGPALPAMVEAKAVALAILARSGAEVAQRQPPPQDLFDRYYRILRPAP